MRGYVRKTTLLVPGALLMAALLAPGLSARAQEPAPEQPAPEQPAVPPDTAQPPTEPTPPTEDAGGEPQPRRNRFRIGPQIGLYIPTDSKTRSRFGDSWLSYGIGIGRVQEVFVRGRLSLDVNVLTRKRNDNRALLIPIGLSYRKAFSPGSTRPYAGASVNLYLADLRAPADNVRSGLRAGGGGSVFTGLTLGDDAFVEARYYLVSRIRGFDLSGLNLTAGYRF